MFCANISDLSSFLKKKKKLFAVPVHVGSRLEKLLYEYYIGLCRIWLQVLPSKLGSGFFFHLLGGLGFRSLTKLLGKMIFALYGGDRNHL